METVILVEFENKKNIELKFNNRPKIKDVLRKMNLNSEVVAVSKNQEFVSIEDFAENGDNLKIIRFIVGG